MSGEEIPPGAIIGLGGVQAFRQHHDAQRRAYLAAATSLLGSPPALLATPYHYDVLATARDFLRADMNDVAVIFAQTACEIALQETIATLLRRTGIQSAMEEWCGNRSRQRQR
jgi:hypothetical protein